MSALTSDSEASDLLAALSVDENHNASQHTLTSPGSSSGSSGSSHPSSTHTKTGDENSHHHHPHQHQHHQDYSSIDEIPPSPHHHLPASAEDDDDVTSDDSHSDSHSDSEDEDSEDSYFGESDDDDDDEDDGDDQKVNHHYPQQQQQQEEEEEDHRQYHHWNSSHRRRQQDEEYIYPPDALLPPQSAEHKGRLCVVLDMDETLIHSVFESAENNFRQDEDRAHTRHKHHFTVVVGTDDEVETAHVYKRPGLMRFLDELAEHCEVVVFTAALPVYAKPVLDHIDPKCHIVHRLYRDATVTYRGQPFVKDLARLGRDLRRCVLVDNNPFALLATPDNAMPIQSFYDDPEDNELEKALQLLLEMSELEDVRPYLQDRFNFRQHLNELLRMSADGGY